MIDGGWLSIIILVLIGVAGAFVAAQQTQINFVTKEYDQEEMDPEEKKKMESDRDDQLIKQRITGIRDAIKEASRKFVLTEANYLTTFVLASTVLVFFATGARGHKYIDMVQGQDIPVSKRILVSFGKDWVFGAFTAIAFLCGALTSTVAGLFGLKASTVANACVAHMARKGDRGLHFAYNMCVRGGAVLSFGVFTVAILNLLVLTGLYNLYYDKCDGPVGCDRKASAYCLAAYALGSSAIAILHRVGGSIYMKAADMCRLVLANDDLYSIDLPDNDSRNPAVIADNVGDNVGDVVGATADIFGSFTQSIAAVLAIVASPINTIEDTDPDSYPTKPLIRHWAIMCAPLLLYMSGMMVSMVMYYFMMSDSSPVRPRIDNQEHILSTMIVQNVSAMVVTAVLMFIECILLLPDNFYVDFWLHQGMIANSDLLVSSWQIGLCTTIGCVCGVVAAFIGLRYASTSMGPVGEIKDACEGKNGDGSDGSVAIAVILGIATGYQSTALAVINLAVGIYLCHCLAFGLGIAFGAIGMLGCVSNILIIIVMGPIAKNALSIAEMSGVDKYTIDDKLKPLASCGHNVLSMAKGYSTAAAAFVTAALLSAFVIRANVQRDNLSILHPLALAFLMIGAMLPFLMSRLVFMAVWDTAAAMKKNIQRQFKESCDKIMRGDEDYPDYDSVVETATEMALSHLLPMLLLILLTPLSVGLLFGRAAVAGLICGCLISGVPTAISAANTGAAWTGARLLMFDLGRGPTKFYIEKKFDYVQAVDQNDKEKIEEANAEMMQHAPHKSYQYGEVCEAIADPLKDAISPSVNVLMKEMAMVALVFGPFFASSRDGYGAIGCSISVHCNSEKYPMEGFEYLTLLVYIIAIVWTLVWYFMLSDDLKRSICSCLYPKEQSNDLFYKEQEQEPLLDEGTSSVGYGVQDMTTTDQEIA
jgi:inorganic pyrophosphatase